MLAHNNDTRDGNDHREASTARTRLSLAPACWALALSSMLLLFLCGASLRPADAQAIYGSFSGTVTDSTGAAIPHATVTVTDVDKGINIVTQTNESGLYLVEHLIPDTYGIKVDAPGFETSASSPITLTANSSPRFDVQLKPGAQSQTVTVTTESPQLKTDDADVSTTLNERSLENLPNITGNTTSLVTLSPGTTASTFFNSSAENPQSATPVSANGMPPFSAGFVLDGADDKDSFLGVVVINPPLDSLSEMQFTTQNYDAEIGAAVAGVAIAESKSGTNSMHGSGYFTRFSAAQEARDPFTQFPGANAAAGAPDVPPALFSRFGGTVGGPIVKSRVFYFVDYEGIRQKTGGSLIETIPTALVRSSCISATGCNLSEYIQGGQGQIYNPNTGSQTGNGVGRTPFPNNIIPPSLVSTPAVNLIEAMPAPTSGGIANNFVASGFGIFNNNQVGTRIDAQLTPKLHIFGHYSYFGSLVSSPGSFGLLDGPGFGAGREFAGISQGRNQSLSAGADKAVNDNLLTDFRFGFLRYRYFINKNNANTNIESDLGMPGLNNGAFGSGGASQFDIAGLTEIGTANGVNACNCPLNMQEQEFEVVDNWTKIRGNHSIKFGADLRYVMQLRIPSDQSRSGDMTFAASYTGSGSAAIPGGLGLGTFLLGDITNFERFVSSTTNAAERQKRTFFYGQDTWRATPKLTISYGARWEIYFPETVNAKGNGGFLDLNTLDIRVAGYGGIGSNFNVKNTFSYIAPRLAIAYQARKDTVVRAAYGRMFDPGFFGNIFSAVVTQTLPALANQEYVSNGNYSNVGFTLSQGPPAYIFPSIPANGLIPLPNNLGPATRPLQMKVPEVDAWNLTVQQQLTPTLSLQVSYVGNKGTHQSVDSTYGGYNINQPSVEGFPNVPLCNRTPFFAQYGDCQYIGYFGNAGSSHYNSLQTVLDKRFKDGFQFQASYVWSKAMANGDGGAYVTYDPRVSYAPFDYNRTNSFILYGNYALPFGRGGKFATNAPRLVNGIIGGITVNGTLNWASGLPFAPTYNEYSSDNDEGIEFPSRVGPVINQVGPLNLASHSRTYMPLVAPLATNLQINYPYQRPQIATFGNLGYNSLWGPHFFNTNLSIMKNFTIHEGIVLQLQAQAQNATNHANLENPPTPCVDCTAASGAGAITNILAGTTMRQLLFAGKITF
jgi:hypothetical protein